MTKPFKETLSSHGGIHRYQQIKELVLDAGLSIAGEIAAPHRGDLSRSKALRTVAAGLSHFPFAGFGCAPSLAGLFRIGAADVALRGVRRSDVFLWAPSYGAHLVLGRLAQQKGTRVIALIHNLESLVPNQPCPIRPSRTNWLDVELSYLAIAEVIFCHSRWDQWILRLNGLKARLLPYYPAKSRFESLSAVRYARRAGATNHSIVILGNAHNAPTRLGMLEQLRIIRESRNELGGANFHFLGLGTTELKCGDPLPNVQMHGYVDEPVLRQHLAAAHAVWFHQPATTGVLTRIVDMLVAGIPVIANSFAARSQETMNGLYIYELERAVPGLIASRRAMPEMPEEPHMFARGFIDTLLALGTERGPFF